MGFNCSVSLLNASKSNGSSAPLELRKVGWNIDDFGCPWGQGLEKVVNLICGVGSIPMVVDALEPLGRVPVCTGAP